MRFILTLLRDIYITKNELLIITVFLVLGAPPTPSEVTATPTPSTPTAPPTPSEIAAITIFLGSDISIIL